MITEMLHDPVLLFSVIITVAVLTLRIVTFKRNGKVRTVGKWLLLLLLVSLPVLAFNLFWWSRTDIGINESPTGEYRIIVRWIDQGGAGYWNTEVIIAKPGFFGERRGIGYSTPLSTQWISDEEFQISLPDRREITLIASDFFLE